MNIVNVGYRSTNYYVLSDARPLLLVDAGWPGTLGLLRSTSNRMGIRLEDIPYQLATHYHPDHAGLCEELKLLGVQLIVVDTQVEAIDFLRTYVKPGDNFTPITAKGNIVISVAQSRAFLKGIGIAGEIVSTPGHSDDCVTLLLDDGSAFTGDLTPQVMVPQEPSDTAYQSWQLLRAKGASTIYPGHGPVGEIRNA